LRAHNKIVIKGPLTLCLAGARIREHLGIEANEARHSFVTSIINSFGWDKISATWVIDPLERKVMQKKLKVRVLAVAIPATLVATLFTSINLGGANAADAGMGAMPKAKAASFPVGGLVDYTKQPYTPAAYKPAAKVKDGTKDCSYHNTSMKDYSGQTLRVLAPPPPNMGEPMEQHGAEFTKLTGGKVIVEHVSVGDMYSKPQTAFQTGVSPWDVVVNFSNKGNIAEARILELLADKFHLFESVFGASDEVLGAIEDGFDFEKKINEILSNSRSDSDIDSAFQELETLYAIEINSEMAAAKSRVFDNLDPNVQDRLKTYDSQSSVVLNKFERLLLEVTKRELRTCATFDLDGSNFHLDKSPIEELLPGKYYFKSTPIENAHQFRFDSPLAEWVIRQALETQTPTAQVTFSISNSQRVSTSIKSLVGKSGELVVKKITFSMKAKNEIVKESYMLAGAFSDEGAWFDDEYVSEILALKAVKTQSSDHVIETKFEMNFGERIKELQVEVQGRNSKYYDQQEELLYRNLQDRHAESEGRIREYRNREKEARKNSKLTDDPLEQLKFKQEARRWADKAEDEDEDARSVRKSMRQQAEEYLSLIAESLKGSKSVEHLFAIRWNIVE